MWTIESDTEALVRDLLTTPRPPLPPALQKVGACEVEWWEGKPGDAIVMAKGGSPDDRTIAEQIVVAQLHPFGYLRARFTFDSMTKTAGWPDIMAKAKRLIEGGAVTILRNGTNNIVGHIQGDHGDYTAEIGRDDPSSRTITTWSCECPWDQYAWQRTRQWKKYEGRPCAHVMALYWKSLATPLDDSDPDQPMDPGQATGPPLPPSSSPIPDTSQRSFEPDEAEGTSAPPAPMEAPMAPPGDPGILPPSPAEQLQMQQPPIPGQTPAGMPANPAVVSVPGAKIPSPFNPIQYPGGTYSSAGPLLPSGSLLKEGAEEFIAPEIVRLKKDAYGFAEGKSEAHGAGQYQNVPAGSTGEVLGQDETTGWVEVIFPLKGGILTPYHVRCFVDANDLSHTQQQPPGPFVKRRR